MQTPHQKYTVRSGTLDSGKEYEFKMVALLSLRCFLEDAEDMWIVSNADSVGAFDDIIFHIRRPGNEDSTYMLQLKHKENSKNITEPEFLSAKGDFSLTKYCSDLSKLKQSCQAKKSGIISNLGDFDKITFALFTNRGVNEYECLDKICDGNNMSILNTNRNNFKLYKFNYNKCDIDISSETCRNLYLISNQIHVKHLDEEISWEIKKIVEKFQLTHVNIKFVTEKFTKYIVEWAKGNLGGHYYLTKRDLYCKLSELLLYQYEVDFNREEYAFYDGDQKHIWNTILSEKLITVVEPDDNVLLFLKFYIGSEVKKYLQEQEPAQLWADNVSKQAHDFFYQDNINLKIQMLKIVGNHGKITFMDVYKCLWLSNKLPLLLQANNAQEYENIRNILKLSNYNLKIIVNITPLSIPVVVENVPGSFITLNDINTQERNIILNQPVKLQGRPSIILRELITEDMFEEIKCKDIIHILSDNFNIGNKYKPVSDCFIERTLSKVFIKVEALRDIQGECFLIQNPDQVTYNSKEFNSANIITGEADECSEEIKKLKSEGKIIHRLILHPECLEWKETFGSIKNIRHYQLDEVEDAIDETSIEDLIKGDNTLNTACIISANPGMGKSTLLDYIATEMVPDRWMVRVNLNDHHDYYETIKHKKLTCTAFDHLMYFNGKFNHTKLSRMVFERLLSTKNILVLLDGFDEISISCKDEVTQIAKSLQEEGYVVWITTRPIMKSYLEEQLNTLSITIEPFSLFDQVSFLTRYFIEITENSEQELVIAKFVLKLLKAAQANLDDGCLEFTGIPLQTMLLADVFSDELASFLGTGVINLEQKFDLVYLYQEFIKRKNEILCDKFGIGSKNMRKVFEKHQQLFALKYLFEEDVYVFDVCKQLKEYYEENQEKIQFLQLEGVLVVDQNDDHFKISFIHRTFAEYLAALWLSENVNSKDSDVRKLVKSLLKMRARYSNYVCSFLFKIFDSILAKGCDAHLAIIHNRIDELAAMINHNPDVVNTVDACGRTALHLMAIYGAKYNMYRFNTKTVEDKMLNIVEKIPNLKIRNIKDHFGYSALDYAVLFWNLAVADKMCEKSQFLRIGVGLMMQDRYFEYCALHKFKSLFKVLLLHFACERILFWSHAKTLTIESFCTTSTEGLSSTQQQNPTLIDFARDFGATTLWDLFQFETMNDLRFTAIYGTKDLLRLLISKGADVNGCDIFHNAPIHYSTRHERLDMIKLLISEGAEIDKAGNKGYTAMHYAVKDGYDDIVKVLLLNGADIDKPNETGNTPLHLALDSHEEDTAKLLLSKGAKINLTNNKGAVPLHYAAKYGLDKIVSILISKINKNAEDGATVNSQKKNGKTPLHCIMRLARVYDENMQHYERTVYLLLRAGADLNVQDRNGNTPLHYLSGKNYWEESEIRGEISSKFCKYMVELLLKKGANVRLKNKEGKTALDLAMDGNRTEIVFLLQCNEDSSFNLGLDLQQPRKESSYRNCALF